MFERTATRLGRDIAASLEYWEWAVLGVVSLMAYAVWSFVSTIAGFPAEVGVSTLLLRDTPFYAVIVVAVIWPLLTILATLIAGRVRPEAGLFCTAVGMLYLPCHGGDARNALLGANGHASVYLLMAFELLILGAVALLCCEAAHRYTGRSIEYAGLDGKAGEDAVAVETDDETLADRLTVVGVQALATLLLAALLVQSPVKGQAIFGVGFSALLAALATHHFYAVRSGTWYVAGTVLAGIIAYVYGFFVPTGIALGDVGGLLAGPARVLPLHYAAAGVAGTLFGYWTGGVWKSNAADA